MTAQQIELVREDATPVPAPSTPMAMLQRAVESGASVEVLSRLMDLQERYERNMARRAFDAAMADLRSDLPAIVKTKEASFGQGKTAYRYEDLSSITEALSPVMAQHGLSFRWRTDTKSEKGVVTVSCVIAHKDGHSEETSLSAGHDTSGSKNAIQALGSTLSYLARYTLKMAIGVAAAADDDGHAAGSSAGGQPITDAQRAELLALIEATGSDIARFCRHFGIEAVPDLPSSRFADAKRSLEAKKAKA